MDNIIDISAHLDPLSIDRPLGVGIEYDRKRSIGIC
jgi:hypothetical protein